MIETSGIEKERDAVSVKGEDAHYKSMSAWLSFVFAFT